MAGLIDDNFKAELNRMKMNSADGELTNLYFVTDKEVSHDPRIRIALDQLKSTKLTPFFFEFSLKTPSVHPNRKSIYIKTQNSLTTTLYTLSYIAVFGMPTSSRWFLFWRRDR